MSLRITIASRKGGSGKSCLSANLAIALGLPIVDLDPQGTSYLWGTRRQTGQIVTIATAVALPAAIAPLDGFIIDTAPHADNDALSAARVADVVLVPLQPSQPDIDALPAALDLAKLAGRPVAVVINRAAPRARHADLIAYIEGLGATVAPTLIRNRAAYQEAAATGRGVTEGNDSRAAEEIQQLSQWVSQWAANATT